jgi:hypothetical protein
VASVGKEVAKDRRCELPWAGSADGTDPIP